MIRTWPCSQWITSAIGHHGFLTHDGVLGSKMMAHTGRITELDNFVLSGQWLQPRAGFRSQS